MTAWQQQVVGRLGQQLLAGTRERDNFTNHLKVSENLSNTTHEELAWVSQDSPE